MVGGPNRGGPGRPPSALREQLRGSFEQRIATLESFADGEAVQTVRDEDGNESKARVSADVRDRIRAIDILAKYGLGTTRELTVDHVRSRLEETYAILARELEPDTFRRIDELLDEVWR